MRLLIPGTKWAGGPEHMAICWDDYAVEGIHDELIQAPGRPRPGAEALCTYLGSLDDGALAERVVAAESLIGSWAPPSVHVEDGGSIDRH